MTKPIFLIEDLSGTSSLVQHVLEQAGYSVCVFPDDAPFLREAEKLHPCVFVVDMVNCTQHARLCERIRRNSRLLSVPILCVSANATERERIAALEGGADDYIPEPFSPRELIARVHALLRRFARNQTQRTVTIGEIELDSLAMTLPVRGELVPLTATEFRLLDHLVRHPGRVFGRATLLEALWRETQFVTLRSVDVYIRRLREKLGDDPSAPRYIQTVRGAGYYFQKLRKETG